MSSSFSLSALAVKAEIKTYRTALRDTSGIVGRVQKLARLTRALNHDRLWLQSLRRPLLALRITVSNQLRLRISLHARESHRREVVNRKLRRVRSFFLWIQILRRDA